MLVSETKQGKLVCIADYPNLFSLAEIRKKESFYCPECREQVILKIGTKKIPHFAHKKGTACVENYERESEYHLNGKLSLYKWLKSMELSPVLEPYYQKIAQRPDIGLNYKGIQYALEFQCSVISEALFLRRTESYLQANIIPIWIMAGKNIKRKGKNQAALSEFNYFFLTKITSKNWMIPAFCPITNTLITLNSILPFSVKNTFAQFTITNLSAANINDLLFPQHKQAFQDSEWLKQIRKIKNFSMPRAAAVKNKFLRELYAHSLTPSLLPPAIGLPVSHSPYIAASAVKWQSYLFIDLFNCKDSFSMDEIIKSFKKRVLAKDISIRNLPLDKNGNAADAVYEYVQLLEKLNILKYNNGIFKLASPIKTAENQMQQMKLEENFYRENGRVIMKSLN